MILLTPKRTAIFRHRLRSPRRGAVALLVLAILSVVLLLVVTFTRTSKLEQVAATNYQRTTQSRIAAATGLPAAAPLVPRNRGLVWSGQSWNRISDRRSGALDPQTPGSLASQDPVERSVSGSTATGPQSSKPRKAASGGQMAVRDLAGSVNVNFVRSDAAFQRFINAALGSMPDSPRVESAGSLTQLRNYLSHQPGTQTTAPFQSLSELLPDQTGGVSTATLDALSSQLTVFSLSPEVFNRADGSTITRALWSPKDSAATLAALQQAYPDKPTRFLAQVAANIQDAADQNGLPALVADPDRPGLAATVMGLGGSIRVTEVYPDSATAAILGDAGQYVEVWNSAGQARDLQGWAIGVAAGVNASTPTQRLFLSGVLPAGGYLALTDNYESPSDMAPGGTGSFVSVFGAREDGSSRLVVQNQGLDLPDTNGTVVLFDPQGKIADIFCYGDPGEPNSRRSFQRLDPQRPLAAVQEATPFRRPDSALNSLAEWTPGSPRLPRSLDHPLDLLTADLRWIEAGLNGQGTIRGRVGLVLGTASNQELDQSVADVFSTVSGDRLHVVVGADGNESRFVAGQLNINTCHSLAFWSLDDSTGRGSLLTPNGINRIESHRSSRLQSGQVPFRNASDLLPLLMTDGEPDRVENAKLLMEQISVGSASFEIVSQYTSSPSGIGRRSSASRQRWVVAYDQEPRRIVEYDPEY